MRLYRVTRWQGEPEARQEHAQLRWCSLEEAQQLADDHAGVPARDPWMPVYPDTFNVVLPEDFTH